MPRYLIPFQSCLRGWAGLWAGVHSRTLHHSQANNGFFSSVAEPKNPMGKRKIVSVKLEQRCWEVSVKQSDPDQPGRFWVELPNPSDVAALLLEVKTSSLGKELTTSHLENCRTKISF